MQQRKRVERAGQDSHTEYDEEGGNYGKCGEGGEEMGVVGVVKGGIGWSRVMSTVSLIVPVKCLR
jgi:hypothetical protein